ncbi:MAG: hypothetical protein QG639_407 [Patescibacteria group bacterium]|jgi:K+-sensing histidine kinase KdpD|nr:hypothetical protein [Patescibacteria group bacterium]
MKKANKKNIQVDEGILHAVGHDIKQPLGLIRAYSYYIQKTIASSHPQLLPYTDKINIQVDVLTNMLQNLLEGIKIQNKKMELTYTELSVSELLNQVISELTLQYPAIKIARDFANQKAHIKADELYLSLAFKNVIENAIQFSQTNTPVQVTSTAGAKTISVLIKNSGSVVPKSDIPYVSNQFFKGGNAKDSLVKGLGLGLFVAEEIVNLHGGSITFRSTSSSTIVVITLPL